MAKTQNSLSDDPKKLGRPRGFRVLVRDVKLAAGAGFVVGYAGDILTMPGLPKVPAAETIDIDEQGVLRLNRDDAVRLALLHSRAYQQQLETLYLSALDVTFERFRFDVQFFGGTETFFTADGRLRPGSGGQSRSTLEQNSFFDASKLFANGAELTVGFANSIVWQFSGENSDFTTSLLDFTDRPDSVSEDFNRRFRDRHLILSSLSYTQSDFEQGRLIWGYGWTEDIPHGLLATLTGGVELGEFETRGIDRLRHER